MYIFSPLTFATLAETPLTTREAISGILGTISIVCWITFLLPQLVENYRNQSAEALSLAFLLIWLFGDLANFLGGFWSGLIPTAVALAAWFVFTDCALLGQSLYYGIRNRRREGEAWLASLRQSISGEVARSEASEAVNRVRRQQQQQEEPDVDEEQPLLKRTTSVIISPDLNGATSTLSPVERRNSLNNEMLRNRRESTTSIPILAKIVEEQDKVHGTRLWLRNVAILILVYVLGVVAWVIAWKIGTWKPVPLYDDSNNDSEDSANPKGAQILGYASALLYLGARIPQMLKNYREQSCEGLSLLLFMMSLSGNLTNGLSLLAHSTEKAYVLKSLPWIIGSLGTIAEDGIIFFQFYLYGTGPKVVHSGSESSSSSSSSSDDEESAVQG